MPKATAEARQQNAHERALATVAAMPENVGVTTDEEPPLPETAEAEVIETKPEPKKPVAKFQKKEAQEREDGPVSRRKEPGEDFFDYLARLPQDAFSTGIYIYKAARTGNVQIDRIYRAITFDDLKNTYAAQNGPGNYLVQFTTRDKTLTPCSQRYTFDGSTLSSLGDGATAGLGDSVATTSAQATSEAIRMVAEASREANKANIELITDITKNSIRPERGIDVAALITGIATLMPKQDNTMVQFMISEANRRADAAEKEAERREQRAKEESDRREREAERRATEAKAEADRQRERDKEFFGILLKQSESKADSLNQMTGLLTSFMKAKEMIDDSIGGGPKGPWDLVAGVADSVLQQGPAIVAALKGAPPAQVEQMQRAQNPAGPPPAEQPFYDMVIRLAKYFGRDPQLYDGHYLCQMLEEEYGPVYSDMINQPKETILSAIAAFEPFGKAIMEHPQASVLMGKIIDAIKFPDTIDDIFGGEEEPEEKEPIILHGKARKINGRAKVERAG
jgi:F0F1-type ATP synthase epsilon subunit